MENANSEKKTKKRELRPIAEMTYKQAPDGDHLIPVFEDEQEDDEDQMPIGKYGSMARKYLESEHPCRYQYLILMNQLQKTLRQVNREATERVIDLMDQMQKQTPPPPSEQTMARIQYFEQLQHTAEEIVLEEIVYQRR